MPKSCLPPPLRLCLTGADVLVDGVLRPQPLALAGGVLVDAARGAALPELALPGHWVLPGMVDAMAGPGADALALARGGVTTALVPQAARMGRPGADLRRAGLVQDADPARIGRMLAAATRGALDALMIEAGQGHLPPPRLLAQLADALDPLGLPFGSIGDADAETRALHAALGARIALFPAGWRAASVARAEGHAVIAAAAASRPGPLAAELLAQGLCSALASDGQTGAMLAAVWAAVDSGRMALDGAWALVAERPARILALADRGCLSPGLRADLVILRQCDRRLMAVLVAGRPVHLDDGLAAQLRGRSGPQTMAAE